MSKSDSQNAGCWKQANTGLLLLIAILLFAAILQQCANPGNPWSQDIFKQIAQILQSQTPTPTLPPAAPPPPLPPQPPPPPSATVAQANAQVPMILIVTQTVTSTTCVKTPLLIDNLGETPTPETTVLVLEWKSDYILQSGESFVVLASPNLTDLTNKQSCVDPKFRVVMTTDKRVEVDLTTWPYAGTYDRFYWVVRILNKEGACMDCVGQPGTFLVTQVRDKPGREPPARNPPTRR